ncbi:MAG: M28 family metallopeptidase [Faecousia sp.]
MDLSEISGTRAWRFLQVFDYVREAGTQGERAAAERICAMLRQLELKPEIEEFPIRRCMTRRAVFRITKPYEKEYPVAGLRSGCSTAPGGAKGEFLFVEEGDDISLSRARGKIVLLSHRPDRAEYRHLIASGAIGLLCVCGSPLDRGGDRLPQESKLQEIENPTLPGAMLHYTDAREIVERGACEAELYLEQEEEQADSRNVTVRIPGSTYPEDILALTAHYDSVPESKGAYDNMAGAAIIFEVCRFFAAHPPMRTMEFTFFGAEEIGCKGSIAFLNRRRSEWPRYRLNLNVDLAGQTVGGTVLGVTAGESVARALEKCLWECGIGAKLRQAIWSGDANMFASCGIPAVTLDRDGFGMHTRHDTVDLISSWALERDAKLLAFVADAFDKAAELPFDASIPEPMCQQLSREYGRFLEK